MSPTSDRSAGSSETGESAKEIKLRTQLRLAGRAVVAFSGGVDSGLLLRVAVEELGFHALGVMAVGASLPERDRRDALEMAKQLGARLELVETDEFEDARYLANQGDRCYWCRSSLVRALKPIAEREHAVMMYGAIVDDLDDDRPGMRAAAEGGITAPLLDAGFSKDDVRRLARRLGLHVWNKPASACLSSRIPTGTAIDRESLRRVDRAETAAAALGLSMIRVRDLGQRARLELDPNELKSVLEDQARLAAIEQAVLGAGFLSVEIDPRGYRTAAERHRLPAAGGGTAPGRG